MNSTELFGCIENSDTLSISSKKAYISRLKALEKKVGATTDEMLKRPELVLKKVSEYENSKTRKNNIIPLMTLFKVCPDLKKDYTDTYNTFMEFLNEQHTKIEKDVIQGIPTKKQEDGYVRFLDIQKMVSKLSGNDKLLVAMYTLIPPMRSDYNRVAIYKGKVPEEHEPNYLLIEKPTVMHLHIGEYKTSKVMGAMEDVLPRKLAKIVSESLQNQDREWLFQTRTGKPYSPSAFSTYTRTVFERVFKKPLTVQILRHSFVDSLDFNKLTIEQRDHIGKLMGQSWVQQQRYRLNLDK